MEFLTISLLNGLSYGLLLFMLSSGLTLIFSMMGVLNFAHASFYMLGAYVAHAISQALGFWPAIVLSPLLVGVCGACFERWCLRRVHAMGHVPELLVTFGLSYIILEVVQLIWGRSAMDYRVPPELDGPLFTLFETQFPIYRAFMMGVSLWMLLALWVLLNRTQVGLLIQAALTHPETVQALGHNVPRIFMGVFGAGAALAGLAGVLGVRQQTVSEWETGLHRPLRGLGRGRTGLPEPYAFCLFRPDDRQRREAPGPGQPPSGPGGVPQL